MSRAICDFCVGSPASCAYLVSFFDIVIPAYPALRDAHAERFTSEDGAWGACAFCAGFIDRRELAQLIDRVARVMRSRHVDEKLPAIYLDFLRHRLRPVYTALFEQLGEKLPLSDPRIEALKAKEGAPYGVYTERHKDGSLMVEPLFSPGPHPLSPQKG